MHFLGGHHLLFLAQWKTSPRTPPPQRLRDFLSNETSRAEKFTRNLIQFSTVAFQETERQFLQPKSYALKKSNKFKAKNLQSWKKWSLDSLLHISLHLFMTVHISKN